MSARACCSSGTGAWASLVESLAPEHGFSVVGTIDEHSDPAAAWPAADVAIDFSVADAVPATVAALARRGHAARDRHDRLAGDGKPQVRASAAGIGVVAAPNFAIGVNVFLALDGAARALMAAQPSFGAWIHELHHAAKKDAPSGTALAIERALRDGGLRRRRADRLDARRARFPARTPSASTRASETITLTHQARDRARLRARRARRGALDHRASRAGTRWRTCWDLNCERRTSDAMSHARDAGRNQ